MPSLEDVMMAYLEVRPPEVGARRISRNLRGIRDLHNFFMGSL
jgi:hypothetical protein